MLYRKQTETSNNIWVLAENDFIATDENAILKLDLLRYDSYLFKF